MAVSETVLRLVDTTPEARAKMVQGLRAFADVLELGGVPITGGCMFTKNDDGTVTLTSDLRLREGTGQALYQWTNPANLPADVRQKMLHHRDAMRANEPMEAHHWIYAIACPSFECADPWAAIEGRACACGPHPVGPPIAGTG